MSTQPRDKRTVRPAQICQELGIQPYVLKFWEGEIAELGRRIGPKRLYGPLERRIAGAIHRVIEVEGGTIAEAREVMAREFPLDGTPGADRPERAPGAAPARPPRGELEQALAAKAESERQLQDAVAARRRLAEEVQRLEAELEQARAALQRAQGSIAVYERELGAALDAFADIERLAAAVLGETATPAAEAAAPGRGPSPPPDRRKPERRPEAGS